MMFNQITLIGVGLMGGSLMLDLKQHKAVRHVVGIDLNVDNLNHAIKRGVIDEASTYINAESILSADLVLLATPVSTFSDICIRLEPYLSENTIVSDVGSTKQSVLHVFEQSLPQHFERCVAAHPIAGIERSGVIAAQFNLFQNKKLILCPHKKQDPNALERIQAMWQQVGATIYHMSAVQHDAIFAAVSHLPHLLSFSYMQQILQDSKNADYLTFAGSGFRDFTRIAASSPEMWRDIALDNRESLLRLLEAQQQQLNCLTNLLRQGNEHDLYNYFSQASLERQKWDKLTEF